jgi:hypothetical protein
MKIQPIQEFCERNYILQLSIETCCQTAPCEQIFKSSSSNNPIRNFVDYQRAEISNYKLHDTLHATNLRWLGARKHTMATPAAGGDSKRKNVSFAPEEVLIFILLVQYCLCNIDQRSPKEI